MSLTSRDYNLKWRNGHKAQIEQYVRLASSRFRRLKYQARIAGRVMLLTFEQYKALLELPCNYCGGALPETGGCLDRLDHRIGYIKENVVSCCKDCNRRKGGLEQAGFNFPRTVELMRELLCS